MASNSTPTDTVTAPAVPQYSAAAAFLEALAAQDFDRLQATLSDGVTLKALLPRGFDEWAGNSAVGERFRTWFGDTSEFALVDASVGDVGGRLAMRWAAQLRAERFDDARMVIEQHAFAETDDAGQIRSISLLCSGFRPVANEGGASR